jgi:uncharacterized DUF497 family protein
MELTFDPVKDAINPAEHGLSLAEAEAIDWETLWALEDRRLDYGEVRMLGFAYIGLRLYCGVYTDRDETRRIISLRKANSREVARYAEA